ncbi:phosphonate ABC transporter, ATP-binding protein [Hyphomonas neptunium ATCC 15444]|uniref:Phosphonates import ATP-binding protein PhnC n=2 Tax=Hyphomonas TaxID=85 RepID=PHNC_HYPNA|nr:MULTISPECIES: phosphonate ABC transporter ATP-binding protein [Hyphomonas]Q0BZD8.1 RecName: Full=Phosphonates import ATP-binding protein PhnC [Hyphomonas neptunium ATCC 15444]ABI77580.1 phosphonate ABC transporter, ATP-binding protein [Hyphomonas neptunium ATCC 15444]KCZ95244.1 phosphonate ABC transporter ATP-binding protein [Hyphomonas hirschiana VP5]
MTDEPALESAALPVLCLENTSAVYAGGVVALSRFNLEVQAGEFCVILGPSGSGKSTLLRLISGLVPTSSGTVTIGGIKMAPPTRRKARQRLGMVHQDHGLIDRLSVLDNVMAGCAGSLPFWRLMLRMYPRPVVDAACQLLDEVGLTEAQANRRARELSGGQRQRVGIARALMGTPLLILADEPVASLDPQTSRIILALLRRAAKDRGIAVLCSLHQMDLAREFADRIVVMRNGRPVFNDCPAELSGFLERSAIPPKRSGAA